MMGNVEQLSWFHISPCLAVEALSRRPSLIGRNEAETGWVQGALGLMSRLDPNSGILLDPELGNAGLSAPTFPSAYACMALIAFEKWISNYKHVQQFVEPPQPEIQGATINKVAGLIVKEGKLLLVRKFGTDQLIMPGGAVEQGESQVQALERELVEELGVEEATVNELIGTYKARAAFEAGLDVEITLFHASLSGTPKPCNEIEEIVWHHPFVSNHRLSPIIRENILPGLREKGIL